MAKLQSKINPKTDRIVVLIDMDCFYCQVEEKLNPSLRGKPMAVVQYNAWKGGGIIAVNYPARDQGVTRHMRGDEAKKHCPDIELVRVPNIRQKADLSKYRDAGKDVASVLQTYTSLLERASVDEAYLDITDQVLERLQQMNQGKFMLEPEKLSNSYAVGYSNINDFVQDMSSRLKSVGSAASDGDETSKLLNKNDIKLLIAASIVNEIRADVKEKTEYECSAGIAHNKILAKLVCGINKPNKQTLLPIRHLNELYRTLPIKKIKGLGGKFGDEVCEQLNIKFMYELEKFGQEELQRQFDEKNGLWLHQIGRGFDIEPVTARFSSKSIGCCKKFPGRTSIKGIATLKHWLNELANEIFERLEKDEIENNRKASQMTVSYMQEINQVDVSSSRSLPLNFVDVEKLAADALDVIRKNTQTFFKCEKETVLNNAIKFLGINVGKFVEHDSSKQNTIQSMFQLQAKRIDSMATVTKNHTDVECSSREPAETHMSDTAAENKCTEIAEKAPQNNLLKEMFRNQMEKANTDGLWLDQQNDHIHSEETSVESVTDLQESNVEPVEMNENITDDDSFSLNDTIVLTEVKDTVQSPSNHTRTGTKLIETNDTCKEGYKQTYAEFHQPTMDGIQQLLSTESMQRCSQCKKNVPIIEYQTHADAHLAFQLSQQQRIEYRNQLKAKSPASPASKRLKLESKCGANTKVSAKLLETFLKRQTDENAASAVQKEMCRYCGKLVASDAIGEHMDYHAAKRLQFQFDQQEQQSQRKSNSSPVLLTNGKKSSKGKPKASAKEVKAKESSIATFFKNV